MRFLWFLHGPQNFYMNVRCSNMDLRESTGILQKFFHKGLRVQLATELFCLETSMV